MKTLATVALLIVGFSYVTYAYPPTLGTANQCCGVQPEDLRMYRLVFTEPDSGVVPTVILPEVEGNGFVITHIRAGGGVYIYQDVGEGPEEILYLPTNNLLNPTMQFPLVAGSTILATGGEGQNVTIIGYVY